jgi:hypothetical protein
MSLTTWSDDDLRRMKEIEHRLATLLTEYRGNTESALAVFACVRIARTLLRLYPKTTEQELRRLCIAFLNGETAPPGVETESGLLLM